MRGYSLNFFSKRYFYKRQKNWKNSYGFWTINKFIWNEKRISHLTIYWTILFINLLISFRHYYYAKKDFFDMGDFFQFFVISRSSEIVIKSNFLLGIYVPYILNLAMFFSSCFFLVFIVVLYFEIKETPIFHWPKNIPDRLKYSSIKLVVSANRESHSSLVLFIFFFFFNYRLAASINSKSSM